MSHASVLSADPEGAARLLARYASFPAFITVQQAAEITGLSRSSAYRAIDRGELPVVRLGGRLRVPVAGLLVLMGLIEPLPAAETPWAERVELALQ